MFARPGPSFLLALAIGLPLAAAGCDKPTHDNIEKWRSTEQGPEKLQKALTDETLDPDLSAHAAATMIKTGRDTDVRAAIDAMPQPRRDQVVAALAPRLWDVARIEGEMQLPKTSMQVVAKDMLVGIRKYADAATKQKIDQYLVDWYAVPSYDDGKGGGRVSLGAVHGDAAIRLVGAPAAKKLMEVANGVIAAPGQEKSKYRIGDELMVALAATCTPETVKYVIDIAHMQRGDATLADRAMSALYKAYVNSNGEFEACDHAPLVPNMDALLAIATDEKSTGQAADDAVALVGTVGPPQCLAPLVGLISHPHPNPSFKYVGAQAALRCGGTAAIPDVVHALPDGPYDQRQLLGGVVGEITRLTPRDQVLSALRQLLDDRRVLARWVAVEGLAAMKSVEDAPKLAAINSKDRLIGYWGDERKAEPTLGDRAKELSAQLTQAK